MTFSWVGSAQGVPRVLKPCLSGILRMTLSWVGSSVLDPGIPLYCPEFLECGFSLINYQHSDAGEGSNYILFHMLEQLVIINLKSAHVDSVKMAREHEKAW